MVSLVDLLPAQKTVTISTGDIEVFGLNGRALGELLGKFPQLRKLVSSQAPIDPDELVATMPDIAAAIIARGTKQPEAEAAIAENMPVGDQAEILMAVGDLTMPRGFGPFAAWLARMAG